MNLNRIKRPILSVFLPFLLHSPLSAQIRLAAIGGVHSSSLLQNNSIPGYDTASGRYYSSKTGFTLGVMAEIPLGKYNLFLQSGILYSAKGNQYEKYYDSSLTQTDTLYDRHTLSLNYVEIPFFLTWKIALSKNELNHFYLSAGPYFAFIYAASQSYQNRVLPYNGSVYNYNTGTVDLPVGNSVNEYKTYDIGIGAKAGFELGNVLIGAYFSHGLTNVYTAPYPSTFHNQVFGGSLGIWLNKAKPLPVVAKDTDHDGTPDMDDSCKTIAGSPRYHGCPIPDTDHDGINDEQDSCRLVPGLARYHGCPIPDSDLDGVNDEEDSCKNIPGSVKYHGCPIPDRDQDGVNNEMDRCPDQPGPAENQGCPVLPPTIVQRAKWVAENVNFQINSTRLTENSLPAIRELADSLKTNSALNLLIEGYTDNTGSAAHNRKLSLQRALAVKKILLQLAVASNRIQVSGLGDARPVANNNTPEGKAKNRRVVFVFQLKNR